MRAWAEQLVTRTAAPYLVPMRSAVRTMAHKNQHAVNLEAQLAILEEQLIQAQKLSALGTLMSTTTHEFNNVLMTIINYAKLGLRNPETEARTKAFEKILAAGQRAAKITTGVLSFARNRSSDTSEAADLRQIVDDTLVLIGRELQKYRITLELKLGDVPPARANGNQIQQVLLNLVINARQAMASGGRLLITLRQDAKTDMLELAVRDSGCGMSPEVLHRIFDPFYTTKSGADATGKGGTGLGLSACRKIIESHQGKIRVESAPGKGTVFTIKLPVATSATSKAVPIAVPVTTGLPLSGLPITR